jgi:hypothetical protein
MKVEYRFAAGLLGMNFHPEEGEGTDSSQKVKMGNRKCTTYLPDGLNLRTLHPDVLGLVALLIAYPYTKSKMTLSYGVSQAFHNEVKKTTNISMLPIDTELKPRKANAKSVPALAYSGGIDCTACLVVMPSNTCCVFHERTYPKGHAHNMKAAIHACKSLQQSGRKVYRIRSDFDDVRDPKGFAVEMSTAIPALLLSDFLKFDSVAVGTHLEYFIDHSRYYENRTYSIKWENLFRAVDIQLNQPMGGVTSIGTYRIAMKSPYIRFAESCTSGSVGKPCMKCFKCFRKQLIKLTLQKKPVSDAWLDQCFLTKGIRDKLQKFPVFFENVMTYNTAHYSGNHPLMILLKRKTRGDITDVSWMEKWHRPSGKLIPNRYRTEIAKNIKRYLKVMTDEDEKKVAKWQRDFERLPEMHAIKKHHSAFVNAIRNFK